MKRRDFISLLGGAAAWPLAARAQHLACDPMCAQLSSRDDDHSGHVSPLTGESP
jgi:hypothetical protein